MSLQQFKENILPLKDKLFRYAFSKLNNLADAEDAVQDVLLKIWDKRSKWGHLENIEAYCIATMRNQITDFRRKKKVYFTEIDAAERLFPTSDQNPMTAADAKNTLQKVLALIATLPQKQQDIFHLREVEGWSYLKIAETLDISEEQVKVNLFRIRKKLKTVIEKLENYGVQNS